MACKLATCFFTFYCDPYSLFKLKISSVYIIVVICARLVCMIYTPKHEGHSFKGNGCTKQVNDELTYIPLSYRTHQPVYVTNKIINMKPRITTTQYPLVCKYDFEVTYTRVKQHTYQSICQKWKLSNSKNKCKDACKGNMKGLLAYLKIHCLAAKKMSI